MINKENLTKDNLLVDMKIQSPMTIGDSVHFLRRQKPKVRIGFYSGRFSEITGLDCVFLSLCKTRCDLLVVGVESDYSARVKKDEVRQTEKERMFALASLSVVDYIILYDDELPTTAMSLINPDVVFTGLLSDDQEQRFIPKTEKIELINHPFERKVLDKKVIPLKYFNLG